MNDHFQFSSDRVLDHHNMSMYHQVTNNHQSRTLNLENGQQH